MKSLYDITSDISILETKGNTDITVSSLTLSSSTAEEGSLFTAIVGNIIDGHLFIADSIKNGARAIVYQNDLKDFDHGITYIKVNNTKEALGVMASNFYGHPSSKLKLIGITGTNGKTTTATLLHRVFRSLGYKAGMIGTVVNKINDDSFEADRTTPNAIVLNDLLSRMVEEGCEYCFMEVSSHAVVEKRISGLLFIGGVFTNLTLDHLDYHKTIEDYRDAKKEFFDSLGDSAFVLSNLDDANGEYMLKDSKAKKYFYSLKNDADLPAGKTSFTEWLETKLIGEFNAYNALAVYATTALLGQDKEKVREIIKNLEPVEGRFEYFKTKSGVTAIVDYAHTPDALENVLKTTRELCTRQDLVQKIITVIGCGGDRDKTKRPIMAKIGYDMSDILILTSDNPRTEDPISILEDMKNGLPSEAFSGVGKVFIIADRHEAIKKGIELAQEGDYTLVAGKGHEKYQEVNGIKNHFDDMEELKKNFK